MFSIQGCGFDYCRLSIGANDFAESWYSYNETEGDYEMKNFSIERDKKYIMDPEIKLLLQNLIKKNSLSFGVDEDSVWYTFKDKTSGNKVVFMCQHAFDFRM